MADDEVSARAAQLYEEGARILASAWDDDIGLTRYETPSAVYHDGRGSLAYAGVLLREGNAESLARADRIIKNVAAMQELRPQDAHYGNFRWYYEYAGVTDLNAVEFVLDALNHLIRIDELIAESRDVIAEMIRLGLDEIDRLDVHPSYTNIALSDICNSILGGEAIDDPAYVERGARRLDEWFDFTNRSGAPHEYNSPTYLAVDLGRMATLAEETRDARIALKARVAEERLWLHVAAHYHPQLAQLAGPHARSYRDGWTGAGGYLKLILWKVLGDGALRRETRYYPKGREEGHIGVAQTTYHCPEYVLEWLRSRAYPFESRETAGAYNDIATYATESYALGVAAASYGVGAPPEPSQQPNSMLLQFARDGDPGYGVLYSRYVSDDRDKDVGTSRDLWDEGRFVGAQHGSRAILAYGLIPRLRPTTSYKLSLRMLGGASCDVWASERKVTQFPHVVAPGEAIVVDGGRVYVAMIALEPTDMGSDAPIELSVIGDELVLDVYNYRGPPKSFWEYQSLAGAFFKGNVRNAAIIEVADRSAFEDVHAFRANVASASVADSVDEDFAREIVYASGGAVVSLRYSLWDMSLIERKRDGVVYVPPMGRAGALDGRGAQWVQSRDALIELGGARLMAGRTPKWLFADGGKGRYVFVNPSDETAPVWLETPQTIVESDEFAFGRIEIDEGAQTVAVETLDEIAPLRLRTQSATRLILNGADITSALGPADADGMRELTSF